MLNIRNATKTDFEKIMNIYRYAQEQMIRSGNPDQWGHSYPAPEMIENDIEAGVCKLLYDESGVHGVFALFSDEDPTYKYIEDGGWLNDDAYVTIHRIAGDGQVHGVFRSAADHCKSISRNVRIDTHDKNMIMRSQVEKNDFIKCGVIYVADGTPRLAYQWTAANDG